MAERQITCELLKIIDETSRGNSVIRLQIVRWNEYDPVLEKREYYIKSDGSEGTGKAKGLNHEDFELIMTESEEIQKLLEKEFEKKPKKK